MSMALRFKKPLFSGRLWQIWARHYHIPADDNDGMFDDIFFICCLYDLCNENFAKENTFLSFYRGEIIITTCTVQKVINPI